MIRCRVCILHHIGDSDGGWNNCPLCEDYAFVRDLRGIDFRHVTPPAMGQRLEFRLVKRGKHSTLVVPQTEFALLAALPDHRRFTVRSPAYLAALVTHRCRCQGSKQAFLVEHVTPEDVLRTIIDRDDAHLHSGEYEPDDPFYKQAVAVSQQRRDKFAKMADKRRESTASSPPRSPPADSVPSKVAATC